LEIESQSGFESGDVLAFVCVGEWNVWDDSKDAGELPLANGCQRIRGFPQNHVKLI